MGTAKKKPKATKKQGRRAKKYSQATRVLKMVDYLSGRRSGASYAEIGERFDITPRQARRDIAAIEEAGYVFEPVTVRGKTGVRLHRGQPGAIRLSLSERYALLAVRRVFDVLGGTPFAEDVRSIYDKVTASMPAGADGPEDYLDRFVYLPDGGTKRYDDHDEILDALLTGVLRTRRVRCSYTSARGHTRQGELSPYAIVLYRHGLYVVGEMDDGSGIRVYAAERFTEAEWLKGQAFYRPAEFTLEQYFEGAFGVFTGGDEHQVVCELSPEVAHLVAHRTWHPSQEVTAGEGGWLRLRFEVSNLTQVRHWLVGWGTHVRVLEPEHLADEVRATHRAAGR